MKPLEFLEISLENALTEGLFCIKNPKYPGFQLKLQWLQQRAKEGLKLKLLKDNNTTAGFIEYVPGEFAWRPVKAKGYLFIHCLWVYPKKNLSKGYGSALIQHVMEEAKNKNMSGVATIISNGSWMAGKELFLKNGFKHIASKDRFELLIYKLDSKSNPEFIDWESNAKKYQGLHLLYSNQCPYFIKSVDEIKQTVKDHGLDIHIKVLESAKEAQQSPSGYGTYSLVYNGKVLADHYISNTRFKNILKKEILK